MIPYDIHDYTSTIVYIYICYDNCNCTVISICITNIQLHSSMLNIPIYQETVSGVGAHWRGGRRPGLEKLGIFRPCFWPSGCFNLFDILYSYGKSAFFMAGGWFIYIYYIYKSFVIFSDFEHQSSVGRYIPNSWVMWGIRTFTWWVS